MTRAAPHVSKSRLTEPYVFAGYRLSGVGVVPISTASAANRTRFNGPTALSEESQTPTEHIVAGCVPTSPLGPLVDLSGESKPPHDRCTHGTSRVKCLVSRENFEISTCTLKECRSASELTGPSDPCLALPSAAPRCEAMPGKAAPKE